MDNEVKLPGAKSLQQVVGALLFGSDHPLTAEEIRTCLKNVAKEDTTEDATVKLFGSLPLKEIKEALDAMQKQLKGMNIGFELQATSSGYRFQTEPAAGRWVRNLLKMDRPNRLSHPALETLAIVAYRQPIAKSEIEGIRGVDTGHILKTLMELHLVRIVGRSELPGRPFLYGTTATFLDHFGLSTLKELNDLDPTLQRSKPSERKALHTKKKKETETEEPVAETEQPVSEGETPPAEPASVTDEPAEEAGEVETSATATSVRNSALLEVLGEEDEGDEPVFDDATEEEEDEFDDEDEEEEFDDEDEEEEDEEE